MVVARKNKRPLLWATLMALLGIMVLISLNTRTITGNAAVQTISWAEEGSSLFFEVQNVPGVKDATVTFRDLCKQCLLSFSEDETLPFSGISYSKFLVASPDEDKIGRMNYTLKLDRSSLQKLHLKPEEVQFYVNGDPTPITLLRETESYVFYQTFAAEMGAYVIGKKTSEERKEIVPAPDETAPQPEEEAVREEQQLVEEKAVAGEAAGTSSPSSGFWGRIQLFLQKLWLRD